MVVRPVRCEIGMATTGVEDIAGRARRLEELGYDYLAVGEHVSFHVPTASALVTLGAAAAVTERIKLLTSVLIAPLYPAALLAKMSAALDHLSGGRFNLGVGVGGENPGEFQACGVRMQDRGRRTDEVLEIVKRLWTEDEVEYAGQFASLEAITMRPKPVQDPHPPIRVSGRKPAAVRRAARFGDVWFPYLYSPEMIQLSRTELAARCEEFGRRPDAVRAGALVFVSCHEDPGIARERALERLGSLYHQDFRPMLDRYVAVGGPDQVRDRLRQYIDAGVESLILGPACEERFTADHERLLADEVIPALR